MSVLRARHHRARKHSSSRGSRCAENAACGTRISRYPDVEILGGVLAACAIWRFGPTRGLAACGFWAKLALTFIDLTRSSCRTTSRPFSGPGYGQLFRRVRAVARGGHRRWPVIWRLLAVRCSLIRGKEGVWRLRCWQPRCVAGMADASGDHPHVVRRRRAHRHYPRRLQGARPQHSWLSARTLPSREPLCLRSNACAPSFRMNAPS